MAHKDSPSLDHIDPLWEEGRDYQLVCGRDCERNWRELTVGDYSRKSNRFLPWRYCADEIGQKPCETGDWVQFLVGFDIENDVPGEWVLMEFESPEWFEATREYCAERQGGLNQVKTREWHRKGGEAAGQSHLKNKTGIFNEGYRSSQQYVEDSRKGGVIIGNRNVVNGTGFLNPDYLQSEKKKIDSKKAAEIASRMVWESTVDWFRANAGNVARHNIANGWDPADKRRIT